MRGTGSRSMARPGQSTLAGPMLSSSAPKPNWRKSSVGASRRNGSMQLLAENLSDVAFRQVVAKFGDARHFVVHQAGAKIFGEVRLGKRRIALDDEELDRLAGTFVRYADHRRFAHTRMPHDDVFHLVGKHLEAGDDDHVLLAIEES